MSPERIRNRPYSYMSDIWSLGLVIMECATGRYPFHEHTNCIEVAQTILDADIPALPDTFSPQLKEFVRQCLQKNPDERLAAEALLCSPWLTRYGATSVEVATDAVYEWVTRVAEGASKSAAASSHK
jgi:mitogen-activated protein kinase kinase 3